MSSGRRPSPPDGQKQGSPKGRSPRAALQLGRQPLKAPARLRRRQPLCQQHTMSHQHIRGFGPERSQSPPPCVHCGCGLVPIIPCPVTPPGGGGRPVPKHSMIAWSAAPPPPPATRRPRRAAPPRTAPGGGPGTPRGHRPAAAATRRCCAPAAAQGRQPRGGTGLGTAGLTGPASQSHNAEVHPGGFPGEGMQLWVWFQTALAVAVQR